MISRRSNASLKKKASEAAVPDGPFAPQIERRARELADAYRLILEPDGRGGFVGRALEFPTVFDRGTSADECVRNTRLALSVAAATMLEMGERPPAPSAHGVRQTQVNIRLSAEEKLLLEESARQAGFRGISEYIRSTVVAGATRPTSTGAPRRPARRKVHRPPAQ